MQYLENTWNAINCDVSFMLTWSKNCFLVAGTTGNQQLTFKITYTKLYITVLTLSNQDNVNLLKQLKQWGSKWTINWNKYQSKVTQQTRNRNLDFLIDPSFQGVKFFFRDLFYYSEDKTIRQSYKKYFLWTVQITDYNVMIDWRNFT